MTEIPVTGSDSDISSDSWTLLDDPKPSSDSSDIVEIDVEDAVNPDPKPDDGFLSFDEFFQERLLEEDFDKKPQKLRKILRSRVKKGFGKCKAQSLGITVFITIILALTAFTTLCSTLSQPSAEKEVEKVRNEHVGINITAVKEPIKPFQDPEIVKILSEFGEMFKNSTAEIRPTKPSKIIRKPEDQPMTCEAPKNETKPIKIKARTRTKWMVLRELLMDTSLHALVSLIMTNIYLFTLLAEFHRRPLNEAKLKKQLGDLEKTKHLFKELPFFNINLGTKKIKRNKKRSMKTIKLTAQALPANNISCPLLAQQSVVTALVPLEAGKSECERRFDELDKYQKTFDNLKQVQRNRIRLLKQKFKNEVSFIKDSEEIPAVRAEKINRTSQIFIRRLKVNRDKYLLELKKVRELRHKLARRQESCRDVTTGICSLALPVAYDYGEKFRIIKEKFEQDARLPQQWKFD